jgi:sigma-E factor negative regulatory protein RseA
VKQDEVESQLSAMFDGELPAAECELLSRRIDRDDNLRARWGRYALIGAAMRSEPVATARSGFAGRVSAAIESNSRPRRLRRRPSILWNGALAASLVAGVAGIGVSMLRNAALDTRAAPMAAMTPAVSAAAMPVTLTQVDAPASRTDAATAPPRASATYVTPAGQPASTTGLRTELADYIVAHSAYSAPLVRRNVLSELVTGEGQAGAAWGLATAGPAQATATGGGDGRGSAANSRH